MSKASRQRQKAKKDRRVYECRRCKTQRTVDGPAHVVRCRRCDGAMQSLGLLSNRQPVKTKPSTPKPVKTGPRPLPRCHYRQYINSKRWKKLRATKLDKVHHRCEICGSSYRLAVHHLSYDRLGCELMSDLQVLCHDCHANHHEDFHGAIDRVTAEYLEITDR